MWELGYCPCAIEFYLLYESGVICIVPFFFS